MPNKVLLLHCWGEKPVLLKYSQLCCPHMCCTFTLAWFQFYQSPPAVNFFSSTREDDAYLIKCCLACTNFIVTVKSIMVYEVISPLQYSHSIADMCRILHILQSLTSINHPAKRVFSFSGYTVLFHMNLI